MLLLHADNSRQAHLMPGMLWKQKFSPRNRWAGVEDVLTASLDFREFRLGCFLGELLRICVELLFTAV